MKYLFQILFVLLLSMGLAACSGTNKEEDEPETTDEEKNSGEQEEQEGEPEATEEEADQEATEGESEEPSEDPEPDTDEVVMENEAFQVYQPTPDTVVEDPIVVRGMARTFEGTVQYSFEDGHFILDEGFTTATSGGVEWRDFEIKIPLGDAQNGDYRIVLYEQSAKDGSIIHELIIPVEVDR